MVNWNQEKLLFEGEMLFEKVQIREVSSHYRNGHIFLIIFAKGNQNNTFQKKEGNEQTLNINYQEIKPLVIERLIVRAKKLKQLKLKKKVRAKKKENLSETSI